ncbi:glycosyltransferase [Paenibacillus sp. H1-7]|uniref:glycosyltransferase family 2 protein n=1 Tax=Paenibacillus sp. H1-7 TaxID=2282849 RepID=UPI001EF7C354|nr:glycosyltransferase [Paenibacillus sp. H1-7]ULL17000.1 glycosyltransferase [Paenibacillus sp. H1-7]
MLISVVMAVYNGEKYVEEAVRSVLNQTYPHFELIIVDDGSTDRTWEILEAIDDPKVKIIHQDKNHGAASCLNLGIEHAKGDWIAIHDADDISEPNRLEEQALYLQTHPGRIGVSSLIAGRIGNEIVVHNEEVHYYNLILDHGQIINTRLFSCYLCHGTVVFSKKAFYAVGRYNPKYKISYDYDLWLRLFQISPIEKIPKVLYHYRLREDSLGKQDRSKTIAELMAISSQHVYKNRIRRRKRKPVLTIVGSTKGCLFFKRHVGQNFAKKYYIRINTIKDVRKLIIRNRKGKLKAAVLLNNPFINKVYDDLVRRDASWRKKLFKIWNYKY